MYKPSHVSSPESQGLVHAGSSPKGNEEWLKSLRSRPFFLQGKHKIYGNPELVQTRCGFLLLFSSMASESWPSTHRGFSSQPNPSRCGNQASWTPGAPHGSFVATPTGQRRGFSARETHYFLRVIPTLTHYSDIVSDIPSGSICILF